MYISHSLPTSEKKKAIDVAYHFFTNENYSLDGRRAAAERVCVTLMQSCDEVVLREFFLDHVVEIMAVIESPLVKVEREGGREREGEKCYLDCVGVLVCQGTKLQSNLREKLRENLGCMYGEEP